MIQPGAPAAASGRVPRVTTQIFIGLLGIDQLVDLGCTAVNVMGHCMATVVVARWEGQFDDVRTQAFAAGRQ
ncbi:MAG: hypothetical protein AB7I13_15725 [Vicinamibacterales bacterium]